MSPGSNPFPKKGFEKNERFSRFDSELFLPEERLSLGGVEFVGFESKFPVGSLGNGVALKDFKGEFAAGIFPGDF